ncbi:hypothetical protein CVT26_001906 [Gymnopilus dilepis]|uniref:DUF2828 domain-containing protein n=1 Tax=Gymnopilus dilepis TaxID=231916 RepID=A0A409Y3U9_9AGAR|nr:hypothetical protein CVT26_001906 [Gymnopilus dilepis]
MSTASNNINASPASSSLNRASSRDFLLPDIPELFNKDFLDILLPMPKDDMQVDASSTSQAAPTVSNPMMDALKATANQTYTANMAMAYSSTLSSTLDAFTTISRYTSGPEVAQYLERAWQEDSSLTLRIIWNLRSIHDGKGEREAFYRAFGWLYDKHPRTAISNLRLLVEPVCSSSKKKGEKSAAAHGYWKDLLNIVALAAVDQLVGFAGTSTFLHPPRSERNWDSDSDKKAGTREERIAAAQAANAQAKEMAKWERKVKRGWSSRRLESKVTDPKFRALFIAVARLFADQLTKDIRTLDEVQKLRAGDERMALLRTISLAGKWAPTPDGSHDQVTNIATAIAELLLASQAVSNLPSALNAPLPPRDRAIILRSYYQRWILTELRKATSCPEPLMSANRWKEIKYSRVPSICMKNNAELFFKHDAEGFEAYLTSVEDNKRTISGATLLPHELVGQVVDLGFEEQGHVSGGSRGKKDGMKAFKERLAAAQRRVTEAQWKTLIENLRDSGSIDSALAVCDVSGSMGSLYGYHYHKKAGKDYVPPILPAISLSLVLAHLAKPPFDGGFITFSSQPQFVQVDKSQSLYEQIMSMSRTHWEMNTNLQSVFVDLILPLAVKNQVKPEDMIKRLFIFSDMQFDQASAQNNASQWETNYDVIERKYREAGYEVPEIVYWDLSAGTKTTVEAEYDRKGVAMMNGFSPAMLKVFMGEQDTGEEVKMDEGWEAVDKDGESVTVVEQAKEDVFNPLNVMKKALAKPSFDGLVVVD